MREAKPGLLAALTAAFCLCFAAPLAEARPRPAGHHHSNFTANKTFGLGIILGEPSGLSGKYFVAPDGAIDFAVGYVGCCRYDAEGFYLHVDYLWHPISLVSAPAFELPFYVGVGGLFWDAHNPRYTGYDQAIGVRVPFGLAFDFNNVPLDIFIQVVPTIDFFHNFTNHGVGFPFDFSVGVRYWFS